MSVISTQALVDAFEKAAAKYKTDDAILTGTIVNLAQNPTCVGCLREYTPETLAHSMTDAVGEFDSADISTAFKQALNVIRQQVFVNRFSETFGVLSPYSVSESLKLVEAFEKGVSDYTIQKGPKKKETVNVKQKIMRTTKCEPEDVERFGEKIRESVEKHMKMRNARAEREKLDLSDYTSF